MDVEMKLEWQKRAVAVSGEVAVEVGVEVVVEAPRAPACLMLLIPSTAIMDLALKMSNRFLQVEGLPRRAEVVVSGCTSENCRVCRLLRSAQRSRWWAASQCQAA